MYGMQYVYQAYPAPFYNLYQSLQADNSFPTVNPAQLHDSAKRFKAIMEEVDLVIDKINTSPAFATALMNAAQLSDHKKVDELIMSTGVTVQVNTNFNPSGIQMAFDNTDQGENCCKLTMHLAW